MAVGIGPGGVGQPSTGTLLGSHDERLTDVEFTLATRQLQQRPPSRQFEIIFDTLGSIVVASSDKYPLRWPARLTTVVWTLKTAGTSSTTMTVSKNGSTLTPLGAGSATMTLGSGVTMVKYYFDQLYTIDDLLSAAVTAVGTSATGLLGVARFG